MLRVTRGVVFPMAFDTELAARVRKRVGRRAGLTEKTGKELIVRLDPADTDRALKEGHTRVFDLSGRPWILVEPKGLTRAEALARWVTMSGSAFGPIRGGTL